MVLAPSAFLIPGTGTRTPFHPGCGCHPTLSLNHRCPSPAPSWCGWVSLVLRFMDIVAWMCQHTLMKSPSLVPSLDWENATSLL